MGHKMDRKHPPEDIHRFLFAGAPPPDAVYLEGTEESSVIICLRDSRRQILVLEEEPMARACFRYLKRAGATAQTPLRAVAEDTRGGR